MNENFEDMSKFFRTWILVIGVCIGIAVSLSVHANIERSQECKELSLESKVSINVLVETICITETNWDSHLGRYVQKTCPYHILKAGGTCE